MRWIIWSLDRGEVAIRSGITNIDAVSDALDNGDQVALSPVVPEGATTGRHLHWRTSNL